MQLFWLLVIVSEFSTRVPVANAFSTISSANSGAFFGTIQCRGEPFRRHIQGGQVLFSTPPPLSSLSDKDDSSYDNYTPAEVSKMHDVIVSLSEESNDDARRSRLKQILEIGLTGPNGGPKRFAVLFERVLTQVGEQVQREAREKYSERAAASAEEENGDDNLDTESVSEKDESTETGSTPDDKPVEKSPEELKLWALVDMMVQSKTAIKKQNL